MATQADKPQLWVEEHPVKSVKWSRLLAFSGYAATLGSAVPTGYCVGVINSPAVHMRAWCNETLIGRYNLHVSASALDILWSIIVSTLLVGGAIGSFSGAWTANKFGRKGSFVICGLLFIIGAALLFICRPLGYVELLLLGRFIVGLASGITTACLPMYLSEIAPTTLRGTLGVFCQIGLSGGLVLGQIFSLGCVFGSAEHWHLAMSFYVVFVVICFVPLSWYPESPKWLYIIKGNRELACEQLKRLRGDPGVQSIAEEIALMDTEANLKDQVSSFGQVLRNSRLLLPLFIVCTYQGGLQFSGITAIFYYSVLIFCKAGFSAAAAEWVNLGAGVLNLFTSFLGPILMAKINRRPLMLFSTFSCALCLFSFALMLYFIDTVPWFAMGCIACILLFIFVFQFGLGPIPFFIGSELFEVAPRPVAMAMGSVSSWTCNFIVGMSFPSLQNAWGALAFLPFSMSCLAMFFLTKRYLPETRGRDPSQVAPLMANGFRSKVK